MDGEALRLLPEYMHGKRLPCDFEDATVNLVWQFRKYLFHAVDILCYHPKVLFMSRRPQSNGFENLYERGSGEICSSESDSLILEKLRAGVRDHVGNDIHLPKNVVFEVSTDVIPSNEVLPIFH